MTLGNRLRLLREKSGLSQVDLANRLKMPNQNISNYERDFRTPDLETLKKLADFFEVSIDYLIGRTDDPQPLLNEEYIKELIFKEKIKIILPDIDVDDLLKVPPEIRKKLIEHFNENVKMMLNYKENENKN